MVVGESLISGEEYCFALNLSAEAQLDALEAEAEQTLQVSARREPLSRERIPSGKMKTPGRDLAETHISDRDIRSRVRALKTHLDAQL